MDPETLTESMKTYESQLEQINLAISVTTEESERNDLINLKRDIVQLIELTKESLDKVTVSEEPSTSTNNQIDNEYLLFMEEMSKEGAIDKSNDSKDASNIDDELKSLEGMKCQAPHSHTWGDTVYHNALVFGVVPSEENQNFENIKVRVMYTNPTHQEMLPCPYFLETSCKFSDEKCKFSHGETVLLSSLQEYREPKFDSLKVGKKVLAKRSKGLWHRAIIKTIEDDECLIKFESNQTELSVGLKDVMPLENETDTSSDSSDSECENNQEIIVQQSLLVSPPSQALGDWEKYTKGIGSKLMQQMGYVTGTGLGRRSDGRLEPVDAVVLPPGKSLDHCMELRENAGGDENLFSVERRLKKIQRRIEMQNKRAYEREKNKKDVFEFLNNTLTLKKDKNPKEEKKNHRTELKAETNKDLNIAGFRIEEDMKKIDQEIIKIKQALTRHNNVETVVNKNLREKLKIKVSELDKLKDCAKNVKLEQSYRNDKKKLTVF